MALKIIDLDIDESLSATTRVEEVGFVLQPAIETELIYFTSQEFEDTISDYPQYITDNALRAKRWVEQNGYGSCMTPVGKARLNQLANREPISVLTIKRMKAYADRHKKDLEVSKSFDDGCGYLAWYSWGLDETGRVEKWLESFINRTEEDMAEIGERGGVRESKKAPKSDTPNRNPQGEGTAKGDASSTRGAEVTERVEKILKEKSDDFNERYKDKLGYGVNVGMLKSVYQRGIGAYNVSHSPEVKSGEQWALARVNAFLYLVKEGRPENKKYTGDNDLLPTEHPKKATKEEMEYEPSLPPYVNYADKKKKDDMLIKPILFVERKPYERRDEYIGRCTAYLIKNEGKPKDQAYAICISEADSFAKGDKVSFDWDETLSTARGFEIAMGEKNNESTLYIISARQDITGEMLRKAAELEIPQSRIHTTGSNKAKIEKIKELGIDRHYDNNSDVIDEITGVGVQFNCGCMDEFIEMSKINEQYNLVGFIDGEPLFSTPVEAENYGKVTHGCGGYHTHYDEDGNEVYMACEVHPTEEDFSFGVEDYSEEEIETAKMLKFLAETDREQFEAVIGAMRGATEAEIKRRNHRNVTTYFRYDRLLAGSPDREFCTSIEGRYFRRLEIDLLKDINREFGHQKMPYSKWLYKGGPNCVHAWRRFLVQEQNVVDDGIVEGKPGTPPKSMENNGYYSPETKRKSEVAYIVSQQNMSRQDFKADKEKRMLYSPLMLPNILIPRMENNQKYYVRFTPESIEKIQRKFMVEQRLRSNNYEHSDQKFNDIVMVESWIIAGDSDKAYELGFTKKNAPVGSWMGGYKVLDTPEGDIIWNDYIKSGKVKGLSVEGEFLLRTTDAEFFNKYDVAFQKIVEILGQVK